MKKKASFSLLEIMIALFLIAIMLTTLFRFYAQSTIMDKKILDAKKIVFAEQKFYVRLNQIFSNIIQAPLFPDEKDPSTFYLDQESVLFFHYDNGIDPDPQLSGPVKAKIFLDKKKQLNLEIQSIEKENPKVRTEVLCKNSKKLLMHFLKKEKNIYSWTKIWDKEKKTIPSMLKMEIDQNKKMSYVFFLPGDDDMIHYQKKKKK